MIDAQINNSMQIVNYGRLSSHLCRYLVWQNRVVKFFYSTFKHNNSVKLYTKVIFLIIQNSFSIFWNELILHLQCFILFYQRLYCW